MTKKQEDFALCLLSTMMCAGIPAGDAAIIVDTFCAKMKHVRVTIPEPKK